MTQQFHEGQDVEVWCFPDGEWEKAKIVTPRLKAAGLHNCSMVEFPDGARAVFDAEHLRPIPETVK
jgi:hypothetical protein